MKFIDILFYYFQNLYKYCWIDSDNRIVVINETTWFWMFYIYPLVSYYYLDEIGRNGEISAKLHVLTRYEFIKNMKIK